MRCSPANIKIKDMATKQEKEVAKQKAIKGGMPSEVANNVFRMQIGKDKSGIDSGHSFPMKQAYTIRMSPMLQTKDEEGLPQDIESKTIAMPSGALATQTDVTSSFEIPGTPGTAGTPKKSLRQAYDDALDLGYRTADESFEDYAKRAKADPLYGTSGSEGTPATPPTTKTKTETTIDPKITPTKGLTPLEQRRDARADLIVARNIGKMEKKIARSDRRDKRKGGKESEKTKAFRSALENLKSKKQARREQSIQGFAGTQTYNTDLIGTAEQREQLATSGKSTYDTSNLLAMPGSGKKSNEFGRFGYQAGSMLENIAMPMMKFKGKKSTYKK